ncbi:MAG: twin-arginine translocation signal domain-containing protein [Tannerellaceae bacterium]|jgi:predicted metal-dependent phosphoesterase TrpH|nr:twin-arginine translocation signal domain-containing protein [Tannerellaceae bacterium]
MTNRRDFLKYSALLGAGVTIPQNPLSAQKRVTRGADAPAPEIDTFTVQAGSMRLPAPSPRQINIPDVDGFKVLKGDFHIHTLFSDGAVMPADRVDEAVLNGLDIIAISDHIEYRPFFSNKGKWLLNDKDANNYNIWYEVGKPEADKRNLLLINSCEITKNSMPPGHFNALFTTDNNPIAAAVDDWKQMLRVAAEQGAFLLWNHPGWEAPTSGGIEKGAPLRFTDAHKEAHKEGLLHGIELFNDSEYYPVVSDWCNKYDLAVFANSDIHPSELNRYGLQNPLRPITLVLAKERTVESAKEAFFAKRTIGWAAGALWGREPWLPRLFEASVEIKALSGGVIEFTNKSSLPVSIVMGGSLFDLPQDVKRQAFRPAGIKTLTVANWMIGMNKPLEIALTV